MEAEIGHFLHYLINRELYYPGKFGRFWFNPNIYLTEAMLTVVSRTRARFEIELDDLLEEKFLDFKVEVLHFSIADLIDLLKKDRNFNFADARKIKEYLLEKKKVTQVKKLIKYKVYYLTQEGVDETPVVYHNSKAGRPFEFHFKDWIKKEEHQNFEEMMYRANIEFDKPEPPIQNNIF